MPKTWVSGGQSPVPHATYWSQIAQLVKQSTTARPSRGLPVVTNRPGMGAKS